MALVLITRHAETDDNVSGILSGAERAATLTERGIAQAAQLGKIVQELIPKGVVRFHPSCSERAIKTVEIAAQECENALVSAGNNNLAERKQGALSGKSKAELTQEYGVASTKDLHFMDLPVKGRETVEEIKRRSLLSVRECLYDLDNIEMVVIVTHAGFMRIFLKTFYQETVQLALERSMNNADPIILGTADEVIAKIDLLLKEL